MTGESDQDFQGMITPACPMEMDRCPQAYRGLRAHAHCRRFLHVDRDVIQRCGKSCKARVPFPGGGAENYNGVACFRH